MIVSLRAQLSQRSRNIFNIFDEKAVVTSDKLMSVTSSDAKYNPKHNQSNSDNKRTYVH